MGILNEEDTRRGEIKFIDSHIINMRARIRLLRNVYRLRVLSALRTARHLVLADASTYILCFLSVWFDLPSKLFTTTFTFILLLQNVIINDFKCYRLQETVRYQTTYRVTLQPNSRPYLSILFQLYEGEDFLLQFKDNHEGRGESFKKSAFICRCLYTSQ